MIAAASFLDYPPLARVEAAGPADANVQRIADHAPSSA
jgi:hypothetical protein